MRILPWPRRRPKPVPSPPHIVNVLAETEGRRPPRLSEPSEMLLMPLKRPTTEEFAKMTTDEPTKYGDPDAPRAGATDPTPISAETTLTRLESPPVKQDNREVCEHCRGTGRKMTVNDLLVESIALLEGSEDDVIATFYEALIGMAPDLAPLFPADLYDPLSPPPDENRPRTGRGQRDKLVAALAALATSYDRGDADKMAVLDTHLATFGRAHAAFRRPPSWEPKGATVTEYHYVKVALFDTLHEAAGDDWRPEYDTAWDEAYEYAARHMLAAQDTVRDAFGRYPRS